MFFRWGTVSLHELSVVCIFVINLEPGSLFDGRFEIIELVGEGGMGRVYKARHVELARTVALKLLHPTLVSDEIARLRFEREGRVLSSIRNASIPTVFQVGLVEGTSPYIAMEFIEGCSLAEMLRASPPCWDRVVELMCNVCDALDAVHRHGVTHRDLKPVNIVITEDNSVFVVDFGLARIDKRDVESLTRSGLVVGSVYYMSPEQCLGKDVDYRADIYSLGCILYECFCLEPPFYNANPIAVLQDHVATRAKSAWRRARRQFPRGLDAVVSKCLEKDPQARYQSVSLLKQDLERILNDPDYSPSFAGEAALAPGSRALIAVSMLFALVLVMVLGLPRSRVPTNTERSVEQITLNSLARDMLNGSPEDRLKLTSKLDGLIHNDQVSDEMKRGAHVLRSLVYQRAGQQGAALLECEQALHIGRQTDKTLVLARAYELKASLEGTRGDLLAKEGALKNCISILDSPKADKIDLLKSLPKPDISLLLKDLTVTCFQNGTKESTIRFFRRELQENSRADAVTDALIAMVVDSDPSSARVMLKRRLQDWPGNIQLLSFQIRLLHEEGRHASARAFSQAAEAYIRSKRIGAHAYVILGQPEMVASNFDNALRLGLEAKHHASSDKDREEANLFLQELWMKVAIYRPDIAAKCLQATAH